MRLIYTCSKIKVSIYEHTVCIRGIKLHWCWFSQLKKNKVNCCKWPTGNIYSFCKKLTWDNDKMDSKDVFGLELQKKNNPVHLSHFNGYWFSPLNNGKTVFRLLGKKKTIKTSGHAIIKPSQVSFTLEGC